MILAILAALSMVVQDIFEAMKIISLDKERGWLAGFFDAGMWLMMFFSLDIAITSRGNTRVFAVIFITIANVVGQKLGQITGDRFIKEAK